MLVQRRPISVLHVLGRIDEDRGGSAAATLWIADATGDAGDHATVLTTCDRDERFPARASGVRVVACRRRPPRHVSFSGSLLVWLWRNLSRFDLVETHEVFSFPALAVHAVARLQRVPHVVRPHGSLEPNDLRKHATAKALMRPVLRRMLGRAAGVWLATTREEDGVARLVDGARTVVSPVPVPPPLHPGNREGFRARHGLTGEDRVVLFLGRLDRAKGLLRLLDAFEDVADTLDDARLVIAGSGDGRFEAELRHRVAASRHAASIRTVGFVSGRAKVDAFAGADLFVLPSDKESFGIAPVEAALAGVPALLSSEVYVADALCSAGAADAVAPSDVRGLAARMGELLTDDRARHRMTDAADTATAPFRPEHVAACDAALRRRLLDEFHGPDGRGPGQRFRALTIGSASSGRQTTRSGRLGSRRL